MEVVNNCNCRGFGPLLEDKLCLIFKLAPSVCRMTFPILASLLVRLVVLLPFQLLLLSLATPSRWTPLALSFFFSSRRRHTILTCDWSSDVCFPISGRGVMMDACPIKLQNPPRRPAHRSPSPVIGRASCREREWIAVGAV